VDAPLKKILRALSLELRHTLEGFYSEDGRWHAGDLERRLNQIGIWRDRPVKPIGEIPNLSPVDRKARELIDAYLALRSDAGVSQSDAVAEFIRESAYSWANRLFALRCMEARGIIDPVILQDETYQGRSMVHNRFAQRNPVQCTGDDDGLFAMLLEEFRERSLELPDLFTPDSPAVTIRPSIIALKHCIALLSGSIPANGGKATDEVFTAPDAFGWAYQYWNAEEKDRVFEMVRTRKGAKIEGSDIIPATQLYTEPYMVKFLVQNSLGATWMMMHPESKLSAAWEYYVKDADRTPNEMKPAVDITFLDPACGSGHFLIEAFDLLSAMYEEEGNIRDPAAICRSILNNNLFGIDIDERAVQITKAVLWMKAAETVFAKTKQQFTGDGFSEFHDHIIATNIRLPNGKDHLDAFLKKHPEDAPLRPALLTVFEGLQNVHELGSLVQIEEPVDKELKVLKEQAKQQRLDPESGGEMVERIDFSRWKQQVMKRLKAHFQDEAEKALPTELFFSLSAVKGLALFDLLARRYDVVAANPPYMGSKNMGAWLKRYVEIHYPEGKRDLYAAFILRNLKLSENGGRVGMVTQQSWMFLKSFADLRAIETEKIKNCKKEQFIGILRQNTIETIAHLGPRAFEEVIGEVVTSVLFVFSSVIPKNNHVLTCFRLIGAKNVQNKRELLRLKKGQSKISNVELLSIPSAPIVYWITKGCLSILKRKPVLYDIADVRQGMATTNNYRFLRFFWETNNDLNRWKPYAKAGGYKKWAGYGSERVDWFCDGDLLKSAIESIGDQHWSRRLASYDRYFQEGLTYTLMAQGSMGCRELSRGFIFDVASMCIFSNDEKSIKWLLSVLNTHTISFLLRTVTQDLKFHSGYVGNLFIPNNLPIFKLENISVNAIILKKILNKQFLDDSNYNYADQSFDALRHLNYNLIKNFQKNSSLLHAIEGLNEILINQHYGLTKEDLDLIISETGIPAGWFPLIDGYDFLASFPPELSGLESELIQALKTHEHIDPKNSLPTIKKHLRSLFADGPGINNETDESENAVSERDEDTSSVGAHITIPDETFLEELSQKMQIHPISIYWLLKEGIEKEGWRCLPEEKRYTEDLFTVMVLRLLGYRWPKQVEAGEPVPEWADPDGIIPITSGLTHPTLLQQVRDRIATEFPGGKVHEIEKEFEEVVGMSLEKWLAGDFFKHHISQFKKRPVAWQLSSSPSGTGTGKGKGRGSRREPAFSCLVYYHKIDVDILHKIRTQYIGDLINRYGTELRGLEGRKEELTGDQATRKVQLDNWIAELKAFAQVLQDVADAGFDSAALKEIVKRESPDKWTSHDGKSLQPKSSEEFYAQEKRYDPDINDGVRVNIAPLQKAGLLAAEVIAKKDLEKAIADRAEWRSDERRWCREGKLPKCGWWE